ncbi:MAG: hypothetical protein J6D27_07610 [Ruminiclostridium sp.]|nr:hypothetical protein [Ruminiclostridium sp.]
MKKKYVICGIFLVIALAVVAVCLWYFSPVRFLQGVEDNRVSSISVFSGSTGKKMVIEDREEINRIVGNIQSLKLKRNGFSFNYVGFSFSLTFKDKDGNAIDSIGINGKDTIRDSHFFYKCESGEICFAYLLELADRYGAE